MDGWTVQNARSSITEDSGAVERYGCEVVTEVSVGGGDADGLACFQGGVEDRRDNMTANPTGVDLLELEEGPVLVWRGGNSHRD